MNTWVGYSKKNTFCNLKTFQSTVFFLKKRRFFKVMRDVFGKILLHSCMFFARYLNHIFRSLT